MRDFGVVARATEAGSRVFAATLACDDNELALAFPEDACTLYLCIIFMYSLHPAVKKRPDVVVGEEKRT